MIQTYPNYLNQYQIIDIGNTVNYHGVYTEADFIINEYDITIDNSISPLCINNDITDLQICNEIPELCIR